MSPYNYRLSAFTILTPDEKSYIINGWQFQKIQTTNKTKYYLEYELIISDSKLQIKRIKGKMEKRTEQLNSDDNDILVPIQAKIELQGLSDFHDWKNVELSRTNERLQLELNKFLANTK